MVCSLVQSWCKSISSWCQPHKRSSILCTSVKGVTRMLHIHNICSLRVIRLCLISLAFLTLIPAAFARPPANYNEFVARRAKLFEKIPDGIAVIYAAKGQLYPIKFRQAPDFYYLTGIE